MRNSRIKAQLFVFALFIFVLGSAPAQTLLEPQQLLERYVLADIQWSAGGDRIAVVVVEPVSDEGPSQHIWMYDAKDDSFRQLTSSGKNNRSPRWSPDGKMLAFLSSRNEGKPQVYVLPMNGGEAHALTKEKDGVKAFEWSPSGDMIAFTSTEPTLEDAEEKENKGDDEKLASDLVRPVHLRVTNVSSGDTRSLTEGLWRVSEFAWRPDESGLVVSATDHPLVELLTDRLFLVDIDDRRMTEVAQPDGPIRGLTVSPDNQFIAYVGSTGGGPVAHDLFLQPLAGGTARNLTGESLDRLITDFAWTEDGQVLALVADGFGDSVLRISTNGGVSDEMPFPGRSISAFAVVDSAIAFIAGGAVKPQELWIMDAGIEQQASQLNDDFTSLIEPELIRYAAEGGIDIEAALFRPEKMQRPRAGWPTVALIHGGPSGRWSHRINDWAQLLVARGFVVLAPNIRGSTGYGLEFVRANRGDWGGADFRDVMAGIDFLIEEGIADSEKLAIAGWSYGGYMAAWSITQTDRFKAAIVGAPMTDLAVEYGTERADINAYDTWYLGTPYEDLQKFNRMSPMTYVKNARTPALILVGEEDAIDPIGQSYQFYRGLRRYGVPTEMIIYPREPHTLKERNHRIDMLTRMVGWIEMYTK